MSFCSEQKNEIMLHADAENIKIEGFTKCGLANFQAAYYMDLNASSMKTSIKQQAYYKGVPMLSLFLMLSILLKLLHLALLD